MSTADDLGAWIDNRVESTAAPLRTERDLLQVSLSDANAKLANISAQLTAALADDAADKATIERLTAALAAATRSPHYLEAWGEPTFLDEFNGTALDPAKWRVYDGYQLSYDLATVRARNAQVRDGQLHMLAKREADMGRAWTSSYITTGQLNTTDAEKAKPELFAQKYGRFEVRAKIPTVPTYSAGMWPCPLWLRSKITSGEIDIIEAWGNPSTTRTDYRFGSAQWALHQDTNHSPGTTKKSGWITPSGSTLDLSADFHNYAVEWTPTGFTFLLDDVAVKYGVIKNADLGYSTSVFDAPYHLRVQVQVGQPDYWGVPNSNTRDADMVIDWVRVYPFKG